MPRLENWSVKTKGNFPFAVSMPYLNGDVYEDHRFKDGSNISTSTISGKLGDLIVTKSGTVYTLGNPSEFCERNFPNAKEDLLRVLNPVSSPEKERIVCPFCGQGVK